MELKSSKRWNDSKARNNRVHALYQLIGWALPFKKQIAAVFVTPTDLYRHDFVLKFVIFVRKHQIMKNTDGRSARGIGGLISCRGVGPGEGFKGLRRRLQDSEAQKGRRGMGYI